MEKFVPDLELKPKPVKPYVFQEFPKWLQDPNLADPEDHAKGRTLVKSAEEEAKWYLDHGLMAPIESEESDEEVELTELSVGTEVRSLWFELGLKKKT